MATKVPLDPLEAGLRLTLWSILWLVALVDYTRHRHIRGRGWQLQRGLVGLLTLMMLKEIFHLVFTFTAPGGTGVLVIHVFFSDAADAWWLALLLHISCGYSITRTVLGRYRSRVIGLPIAYLCLSLIVDSFILRDSPKAFYTFNDLEDYSVQPSLNSTASDYDYDPETDSYGPEGASPNWVALIILLAAVGSLFCWIVGVLFVFELVKAECEALEEGIQRAEMESAQPHPENGATFARMGDPDESQAPPDAQQDPDAYVHDIIYEVKTVEDAVSHRDKQNLLRRFRIGVYGYVIAYAAVVILPLFVDYDIATQVTIFLYNLAMWAFSAWLLWTFRLREDNPYLLLGEDGQVRAGGTLDASQLDTELGVIGSPGEDGGDAEAERGRGGSEAADARLVSNFQLPSDAVAANDVRNFTLDDEGDDGDLWDLSPRAVQEAGTPSRQVQQTALSMWPKNAAGRSGGKKD